MKELKEYYRSKLKWLTGFIVTIVLAYHGTVAAFQLNYSPRVVSALRWFESLLVPLIFLFAEWFIRTRMWRISKCGLDYSGEWRATTKYTNVEIASSNVPLGPVAMESDHSVTIEQDCFSIAIKPTAGAFNSWYSLAMNILSEDKIGYVYEVNYVQPNAKFPSEAIGFEEMTVIARQKDTPKGGFLGERPVKLKGKFYHCAQGMVPVYRGTVEFERSVQNATLLSVLSGR